MVARIYTVIWDKDAKESLKDIYLYIKEESPNAAKKVRLEI
ncbi:type II toxin-antitoxin system RelE/ParE family toxin [Pedobacter cryophilus]|nr:type II toxin-antitoxin system RelE/ParE family toxin [Pedobacter cryophilus]